MNKLLLILLIATIFVPILSHTCPQADLLMIINRGTGYSLGVDFQTRILDVSGKIPEKENDNVPNENDNALLAGDKDSDENQGNEFLVKKGFDANEEPEEKSLAPTQKIVLNYIFQKWCLNEEGRNFYKNFDPAKKYASKTNIVFNGAGRTTRVVKVKNHMLLDLIAISQASSSANWRITYLPSSGMFSIRSLIETRMGLALSAVSSNPADGVTLKSFNPSNTLQQWIIQA